MAARKRPKSTRVTDSFGDSVDVRVSISCRAVCVDTRTFGHGNSALLLSSVDARRFAIALLNNAEAADRLHRGERGE